ncbi:CarD family transcriptional regulator [Planococcus antarcticus DSM 14505]|uniref:CarD family transcriptional regulator n=1 Tax=Planococcus antarcticus DSM 14505 TaxID=1185653 RepID=A0A1C7DKY5_9BACL|nr:CarD family transcriptional regulator [Planococcus antarcticus]ANU12074.1 CarD family transcriptional regulator [Planococcus antarcticus DSM 14505]EIM08063.1 CarD family transcriptional regulator [Planococcus antarcticus DSM 14505]
MFTIGDHIIYSAHGLCRINDIRDETVSGVTKKYYKLHPLENTLVTISTPVDNDKVVMLKLLQKEQALEIIEIFKQPGAESDSQSNSKPLPSKNINTGDRMQIAEVVNTLMRKKFDTQLQKEAFYAHDYKLLNNTQIILFKELAHALDTSFEEINKMINDLITEEQPLTIG